MGKPKDPFPLQKVTVNLWAGQMQWLVVCGGVKGASRLLREIVAAHINRVNEAIEEEDE